MRLIDAENLMKLLQRKNIASVPVIDVIGRTQTVDPVHAAGGCYCFECKHYDGHGTCKNVIGMLVASKDGFCSNGEEKEKEN